jgi:hypothetical protein
VIGLDVAVTVSGFRPELWRENGLVQTPRSDSGIAR